MDRRVQWLLRGTQQRSPDDSDGLGTVAIAVDDGTVHSVSTEVPFSRFAVDEGDTAGGRLDGLGKAFPVSTDRPNDSK
jgi:hypothetical protein